MNMSRTLTEPNLKPASAAVPCTCGELFQGTLDGQACLVSCPIDYYSTAEITTADKQPSVDSKRRKVSRALEWVSARTGRQVAARISNSLPVGRGYGTSTADIGAALFAAARASGLSLQSLEAAQIAARIEPTDSTFFPGLALFDHRAGRFFQPLGDPPPANLVILDPGGGVDSVAFNACDWGASLAKLSSEHRCAWQLLQQGLSSGDLAAVGEAATLSARCHQAILPNPLVDVAVDLAQTLGATGVCRAHSGTIAGLIFPQDYDRNGVMSYISGHIPAGVQVRTAALVGGGPIYPAEINLECGELWQQNH